MKIVSYRDLIVWQKGLALCVDVYEKLATEGVRVTRLPRDEKNPLTGRVTI